MATFNYHFLYEAVLGHGLDLYHSVALQRISARTGLKLGRVTFMPFLICSKYICTIRDLFSNLEGRVQDAEIP